MYVHTCVSIKNICNYVYPCMDWLYSSTYMCIYTIMLIEMSMCLCVCVPVYGDWMDFETRASLNVEHLVRFNVKAVGLKIIK